MMEEEKDELENEVGIGDRGVVGLGEVEVHEDGETIVVKLTSIAVSTRWTDTEGMLIATMLEAIVGLAQGTSSTMPSQTLLVDLCTIFARVVAVTETDVLGMIVHQCMTHCVGWTGVGGTRIV